MRTTTCFLFGMISLTASPAAYALDLFWNDDVGIHRLRASVPVEPPALYETFETRGIAVDAANGRLWWTDVLPLGAPIPGGVIRSGALDGGAVVDIVTRLTSPSGVAVDASRDRVYWSDLGDASNPSAIYSANLDGSDVQRIISGKWLSEIAGVALDRTNKKIYFTYVNPLLDSLLAGGVARADLDGSNVESIVGAQGKPVGIAVDVVGGDVYWADALSLSPAGGTGAIKAANLDGQNIRTVLGGLDVPLGAALDLVAQNIYWTDRGTGKIQRTAMPGVLPYFEDVLSGLPAPTAIAIAIVPEPIGMLMIWPAACGITVLRRSRTKQRAN